MKKTLKEEKIFFIAILIAILPKNSLGRLMLTHSNPDFFNIGGMLSNPANEAFFNETIDVRINFYQINFFRM